MAAPSYNSHPLPATPQQQQRQQYGQYSSYQRPPPQPYQNTSQTSAPTQDTRKSRGFSFRSDKSHKSHKSSDSGHHRKVSETSEEKESRRLHSKADPTLAISEAEPAAVAQMSGGTDVKPLSSIQHKDINGNPITDPDRSNPTRSRWERPLETIRSFEAAIDGGYDRKSYYRPDAESVKWSRRSSYYAYNTPRNPQDGYHNGRRDSNMVDPRQSMVIGQREQGYQDGGRNKYTRMQSEPPINRPPGNRNVYPMPNNHRSYETVASGSGSGSYGEPVGYQTDPTSSENSSIERRSPPKRQEPMNDYGINFGQDSMYQVPTFTAPTAGGRGMEYAPQPPRKDGGSLLRKVSKVAESRPAPVEKRKSWFSRRFSKNS